MKQKLIKYIKEISIYALVSLTIVGLVFLYKYIKTYIDCPHCPACGSKVIIDDSFCNGCGLRLDTVLMYNEHNIPEQFKKFK